MQARENGLYMKMRLPLFPSTRARPGNKDEPLVAPLSERVFSQCAFARSAPRARSILIYGASRHRRPAYVWPYHENSVGNDERDGRSCHSLASYENFNHHAVRTAIRTAGTAEPPRLPAGFVKPRDYRGFPFPAAN